MNSDAIQKSLCVCILCTLHLLSCFACSLGFKFWGDITRCRTEQPRQDVTSRTEEVPRGSLPLLCLTLAVSRFDVFEFYLTEFNI